MEPTKPGDDCWRKQAGWLAGGGVDCGVCAWPHWWVGCRRTRDILDCALIFTLKFHYDNISEHNIFVSVMREASSHK